MTKKNIGILNFILSLVSILLSGFMVFINFSEWFKVKTLKDIRDYNFGGEGPTAIFYYNTPELYSSVCLFWFFLFLSVLVYAIWSLIKGNRKHIVISFVISVLVFIGMFIHAQIGLN